MTRRSAGIAGAPAAGREAIAEDAEARRPGSAERRLVAVGVSHNTASVELRERLALPGHRREQLLRALREEDGIDEGVALFTCNRTELYVAAADAEAAENAVLLRLAERAECPPETLDGAVYVRRDAEAARHLFRVAAGLDSMIVGENEIQGQVRRSFDEALETGTTGRLTNHLFREAIRTGKRVRAETALGTRHESIPSVALEIAQGRLGELAGREAAVVGAGEISELAARALSNAHARISIVATRTRERAIALARRLGAQALPFEALQDTLERVDLVVSATASPRVILEPGVLRRAARARNGRPLLLIDLAVPRDVHQECRDVDGVTVYDLDDLQEIVATNLSLRAVDAEEAEGIVDAEVARFGRWLGSQVARATVAALRQHGDRVAREVVDANAGRFESLSPRDRRRVEAMAHAIVNRLLHEPTQRLLERRPNGREWPYDLLADLFAPEEAELPGGDIIAAVDPARPRVTSNDAWPLPGGLLERRGKPPVDIETRSRALAAAAVAASWSGSDAELAASCVYASGDPEVVQRLSIRGEPAERGVEALRSGGRVLVDTAMARVGATRIRAELVTAVEVEGAAELAARADTTRAAAGVRLAWDEFGRDGIVVVGNAPTALLATLDLADARGAPACVIATCPGFTLAEESKDALAQSGLPHFAVLGTRGGTGMAVAVLNAIGRLAA
jgi:glutamyl-tRNA reductase